MTIREAFAKEFGEDQAQAIFDAALSHQNGVHDNQGSDPFKWALCIAIGYQCMEVEGYREHHGITADFDAIQTWVREHGDLATHDGDSDYLALFSGVYDDWLQLEKSS